MAARVRHRKFVLATVVAIASLAVAIGAVAHAVTQPAPADPSVAAATNSAKDLSAAFRAATSRVLPAVVAIETRTPAAAPRATAAPGVEDPWNGRNPFEGTPFEDYFKGFEMRRFHGQQPNVPRGGSRGLGSGVIIDEAGIVLTNNHVVAGGGEVVVRLSDGREFTAVDVRTDPKTDLAVVRIDGADNLHAARLADSDQVQIGDWVLALGQPFGLESTVTAGIISAMHRGIGITDRENFLQTDAAINPGNSGGPLVNLDGDVIGINTAISSRSGGNDGIGFAVPVNLAKWVSSQLLDRGQVRRAYLGVGIQPMTQALANRFGVKPREGVVVTQVQGDTPAAKIGLRAGDVIVTLNGRPVGSPKELQLMVERAELNKRHKIEVVRDGKRLKLDFTPAELPGEALADAGSKGAVPTSPSQFEGLGFQVDTLTPEVATQLGLEGVRGVVITSVEPRSPADEAGLERAMVIVEVNRKPIHDVEAMKAAVGDDSADQGVLLLVRSKDGARFVVLKK